MEPATRQVRRLSLAVVHPDPDQPRKTFDADSLLRLGESIKLVGQQSPILVRAWPDRPGHFLLVAGERRYRAIGLTGGTEIDAFVVEAALTPAQVRRLQLTENLLREAMNPLETADCILAYMAEEKLTQAQAAEKLSLSEGQVSKILAIKRLAPDLLALVESYQLRPSVAALVASLPTVEQQREVAKKVLANNLKRDAVERLIKQLKGKQPARQKEVKARTAGGLTWAVAMACNLEAMGEEAIRLGKAMKKAFQLGLGADAVPGLLKSM